MDPMDDRFTWPDYLTLCLTLVLSTVVGLYYGYVDRNKRTVDDFLMAGRDMHFIPVSLSIFVSWLSAIALIGDPVEIYLNGLTYVYFAIPFCLALLVVAHFFAPVYFRLKLTSQFEYLEQRYNIWVRYAVSFSVFISLLLLMGVILCAPSIAMSQVSGLSDWLCIIIIGSVCMFYTSYGGMKAVIWADAIQFIFILAGLLTVVIQGLVHFNGFTNVWNIAMAGKRINLNSFNPSPFERSTFWTFLIGGFFRVLTPMSSAQVWTQRYCTMRSERDVKRAIYLNGPLHVLFLGLLSLCGLLLYAMYHTCDPLRSGRITNPDQMMPLMVLDLLKHLPGLSGVYLGAIVAASLSSLSSGQTALTTWIMSDIFIPLKTRLTGQVLSKRLNFLLPRLFSALIGIITIVVSMAFLYIPDSTVFVLHLVFLGIIIGPVSGLFTLAVIFPFINTTIAVISWSVSIVLSCCLIFGALGQGRLHPRLPTSIAGCSNMSMSYASDSFNNYNYSTIEESFSYNWTDTTSTSLNSTNNTSWSIYKLSPILYPAVGPIVCVTCALLLHAVTMLYKRCRRPSPEGADSHNIKALLGSHKIDKIDLNENMEETQFGHETEMANSHEKGKVNGNETERVNGNENKIFKCEKTKDRNGHKLGKLNCLKRESIIEDETKPNSQL